MAEFHLHGQIIKRSEGRSAVNAAAYRAGEALYDKRLGQTFDYTRKQEVEESIILGPDYAPGWMFDRELLWNTIEAAERRKNAQLAREFDIALPIELVTKDPAAAKTALKDWAGEMFVEQALMVDINFHNMRSKNPHAHIMTTMRRVDPQAMEFDEGSPYAFESTKARDQNDWGYMDFWRETWADYANAAMAAHSLDARIDHRTLIEQGIDREPSIHIGPNVKAMDDRNIETDRATKNAIIGYNNEWEWFEENDRYAAFLEAEATEERHRQEEEIARNAAELKEVQAAAAILTRRDVLEDLVRRWGGAVERGIDAPVANLKATLAKATSVLTQAEARLEADLEAASRAVENLQVRLDAGAKKSLLVRTTLMERTGEGLEAAFLHFIADKGVRFYAAADRLDAELGLLLQTLGTRLKAAVPNVNRERQKLEEVVHLLDKGIERTLAFRLQRLKVAGGSLERTRPGFAIALAEIRERAAGAVLGLNTLVRPIAAASIRRIRKVSAITAGAMSSAAAGARAVFREPSVHQAGRRRDHRSGWVLNQTREEAARMGENPTRQPEKGQRLASTFSLIELVRSSAARLRLARARRKARAEEKATRAAKRTLDRNLRLAETEIRSLVDHFSPETEWQFVADWVRTLKATDGPMETRYEEADLAALKGYARRLERRPLSGDLEKALIRLSPSAGGAKVSERNAPGQLPDGMKPDFRDRAIHTRHVGWVVQEVRRDREVSNHFERLLREEVERASHKAKAPNEIEVGRYAPRSAGKRGPEVGD